MEFGNKIVFFRNFIAIIALFTNMATKIQQILEANPDSKILFSEWLTSHGLDAKEQYAYMKRGWLTRLSKGVYALQGTNPTLLHAVSVYNTQLSKKCIVGAYTALELRGYSHYLSMGKPNPNLIPYNYFQLFLGVFIVLTNCLSAMAF